MRSIFTYCIGMLFIFSQGISAQSIVNTVHNLSSSGPGTIRALSEQEVCVFCHTPHNSKASSPLWNRNDPGVVYDLYASSTLDAAPGQPVGASLLCLSCHDGTIALGNVLSRTSDINFTSGITIMPAGNKACLTTDLSDDHPVSFLYNTALAGADGQLKEPALVNYPVTLPGGYVQCTSCHDPHKDLYHDFLVSTSQYSELCVQCHDNSYWSASSHSTSSATWNHNDTDPWFHSNYTSVSENACENCHRPHSAGSETGLMNYEAEESNCLNCHNGNVATTDIESELSKSYLHNVYAHTQTHDPAEDAQVLTMHSECVDCHNPHAANNATATAPLISGAQAGVKGLSINGSPVNPAQYQYEICFRCHAGSPGSPSSPSSRAITQNNVMLEFNTANPSYHPIAGPGQNFDCPSLISPTYTESTVIYCSDCHSSDGTTAPPGPHGSNYQSILKYQYETNDNTVETAESYALCYSCHSRSSILNDESFGYHDKHIVEENTPCNACHDPHGISNTQGTSTNNSHLINFDLNIVSTSGSGMVKFVDTGLHSGYCLLKCHDRGHGPGMSY